MPAKLINRYPSIIAQSRAALTRGLLSAGEEMALEIVRELHGPKSGRLYGSHRASAPGESPATWTGRLESTITVEALSPSQVSVGTGTDYSVFLEFGTTRMAARPMMVPIADRFARVAPELIAVEFRRIR